MSGVELFLVGIVGFILAIFSGIAGGGGGFIMTPMLILFGLSPAQAVATGKLGGFSMAIGSLYGMKSSSKLNKSVVIIAIILSVLSGIIASQIIVSINEDVYGNILGVTLILIAPIMLIKKIGHVEKHITRNKKIVAYIGLFITLFLQGILSGGFGVFVSIVLMSGLGLSAIQANITKRYTQLVLNSVIIIGLVGSGLILWSVAAVMVAVNLIGSAIGGHIAIRKGAGFVSKVMAVLAFISGLALLIA